MANELKPAHPLSLLPDLTLASLWWSMTVPPLKVLRTIGIARPKLPTKDLSGKVVIVTGANRGIGARTSYHMAEMGATLVLACRTQEEAETAKQGILAELKKNKKDASADRLEPMECDLATMASVRKFAKAFLDKHSQLDILINNAGVSEPGLLPDKSGFSATFTKNHIGHYLLTDLLFDTIDKTPDSRVVILSSVFHQYGNTNWEEAATGRRGDVGTFDTLTHVYADSKLANLLHALDLRRRFKGSTQVFAVHPGNVRTDLWRYVYSPLHLAMDLYMRIFFLSPEFGCYTSVTAAVAPLDQLKEADGRPARFIQPYWTGGLPLVDGRAGHQIGPFAGAQIGTVSLPDNLDVQLDNLRQVSEKLVDFLEKRQKGEIPTDPSGEKSIHPVKAVEYTNLSTDVPVRY